MSLIKDDILEMLQKNNCFNTLLNLQKNLENNNFNNSDREKICNFFEIELLKLELLYNEGTHTARSILEQNESNESFLDLFNEYIIPYIKKYDNKINDNENSSQFLLSHEEIINLLNTK